MKIIIENITPVPASRPRIARFGGVHYGVAHTNFKKEIEERVILKEIKPLKKLIDDLVEVNLKVYIPLPKGLSKKKKAEKHLSYCDKHIDNDNLEKIIWDEILKYYIKDDHLIVKNTTEKF